MPAHPNTNIFATPKTAKLISHQESSAALQHFTESSKQKFRFKPEVEIIFAAEHWSVTSLIATLSNYLHWLIPREFCRLATCSHRRPLPDDELRRRRWSRLGRKSCKFLKNSFFKICNIFYRSVWWLMIYQSKDMVHTPGRYAGQAISSHIPISTSSTTRLTSAWSESQRRSCRRRHFGPWHGLCSRPPITWTATWLDGNVTRFIKVCDKVFAFQGRDRRNECQTTPYSSSRGSRHYPDDLLQWFSVIPRLDSAELHLRGNTRWISRCLLRRLRRWLDLQQSDRWNRQLWLRMWAKKLPRRLRRRFTIQLVDSRMLGVEFTTRRSAETIDSSKVSLFLFSKILYSHFLFLCSSVEKLLVSSKLMSVVLLAIFVLTQWTRHVRSRMIRWCD